MSQIQHLGTSIGRLFDSPGWLSRPVLPLYGHRGDTNAHESEVFSLPREEFSDTVARQSTVSCVRNICSHGQSNLSEFLNCICMYNTASASLLTMRSKQKI